MGGIALVVAPLALAVAALMVKNRAGWRPVPTASAAFAPRGACLFFLIWSMDVARRQGNQQPLKMQ
ncbi:hypothetical protein CFB82_37790 [Burkholderia sp. HI2714]|nr:hypothetical protein CFB82_37790 [Burkholderia sp. HI2714]